MSFAIPTAINQHSLAFGSDSLRRSDFSEGAWNTKNTKTNGSLPLTGNATAFVNTSTTGFEGCYWAYTSGSGQDVSVDTKVVVFLYQHNAPNRLEIDTVANDGFVFRIGTGTANTTTAPLNYRTFQFGGRDTASGKERAFPVHVVIDLNVANHEALVGTFNNTDVTCYGFGSKTLNMGGTTTQVFVQRAFLLDTTKNATNIPRFTGSGSNWDDVITAMGTVYSTKITHGWLAREGSVFAVACPIEIGNNSTITTFDDNGASVFWPDDDEPGNPKVRVTEQAFRVYLNLRNNSADTVNLSGSYNCGNSYPPWDFDQANAAIVTLTGASFKRTGTFLMGSSVTGTATFDDCGVITYQDNGVDLDGSTFKNPHANHLLRLAA